jgi:hypothetical protein
MRGSVAHLLSVLSLSLLGAGLIPAANAQNVVGDPSGWDANTKKSQEALRSKALRAGFLEHKIEKGGGPLKGTQWEKLALRGHYTHNQGFWHAPWATRRTTLEYQAAFNLTAIYKHARQVDGRDYQGSWNKLPGFSDCGQLNMLYSGAMFGWRWDPVNDRLEVNPFANAFTGEPNKLGQCVEGGGCKPNHHQDAASGVKGPAPWVIKRNELNAFNPLTYRIEIKGKTYLFSIKDTKGKVLREWTTPRKCDNKPNALKLGSNLFFGGQLMAPHEVSAYIKGLPSKRQALNSHLQQVQQAGIQVVNWAKVEACKVRSACGIKKNSERDTCRRKCKEKYTK